MLATGALQKFDFSVNFAAGVAARVARWNIC
jgi:hypothetical protein